MTLGEAIKIRRIALGLNKKDLAKKVGIDPRTLTKYESGATIPDRLHNSFEQALDIDVSLFMLPKVIKDIRVDTQLTADDFTDKKFIPNEIVRKRRHELGLTMQELADRIGFKSRQIIDQIERKVRPIPEVQIPAFAKALEMPTPVLRGVLPYEAIPKSDRLVEFELDGEIITVPISYLNTYEQMYFAYRVKDKDMYPIYKEGDVLIAKRTTNIKDLKDGDVAIFGVSVAERKVRIYRASTSEFYTPNPYIPPTNASYLKGIVEISIRGI